MSSSDGVVVARTGREKQRYDGHFRLVSGCIPYKLITQSEEGNGDGLLKRLRVLMISTPHRDNLVFPKGGWETDETDKEAAIREAMEEAGVRGTIHEELGKWEFKSKTKQNIHGLTGCCRGTMFALEVTQELSSWPEQETYKRLWLTVDEAWERCRYDWMREALNNCLVFLTTEMNDETPSLSSRCTTVTVKKLTTSLTTESCSSCTKLIPNQVIRMI